MSVHYLEIRNNKAKITQSLIDEINEKDNEKLESLQFDLQVEKVRFELKLLQQEIKFTKLIFNIK